ncbi:MAG: hypothetical protein PWQ25_1720 [Deferribacteres bacterium]|jgi:predicted transcriptional regulator|nr:hypothetical protein [Deferribacteres bacterium]
MKTITFSLNDEVFNKINNIKENTKLKRSTILQALVKSSLENPQILPEFLKESVAKVQKGN